MTNPNRSLFVRRGRAALLLTLSCGLFTGCGQNGTAQKVAAQEYHGVKVTDAFQWLENGSDPRVRAWSSNQNHQARSYLDNLPTRPLVRDQLQELFKRTSPNYSSLAWRAGKLFLLKFEPPAQQAVLITLNDKTELKSEKVIVDPNKISASGSVSIDWFVPSPDGKLVAVSLSEHGSEDGSLYIYETATGRQRPDLIPRVQFPTAGGSAAWNAEGSGIFYTRYPAKGERPEADLHLYQQIYFHELGTPVSQDRYEFGKDFPRIAEIDLQSSPDGRHLLASVANGDGGEHAHFLRNAKGEWRQVTRFEDGVRQVEFAREPLYLELGRANSLYLLRTKDAPKGEIIRVPLDNPALGSARTVVTESTNAIHTFKPTASGIALVYLKGGPQELIYKDFYNPALSGPSSRSDRPSFRTPTSIRELLVTHGDEILFRSETFTEPFTWWRYDTNKDRDKADATPLRGTSPAPFSDVEAVRVEVTSKDGTRVPMTIVRKKGTRLTGDNATLLTGYGGFGISRTPTFDFTRRLWLDQGGVMAIANLRGGGEFGEEWHRAGNLTKKQNVFDDFAACAEWLVRSNYTRPDKLAIEGGSNGGLLVAALLTQRPELVRAVVSHVGLYDMLRVENDPNGIYNVTEYGSVLDAEQFKALHAYSPYHRVQDKTAYPAVLMLTGERDGRVNPAHSRKMTARLQEATSSKEPVLLRTSSTSGHGIGTALNERVEQLADVYAFLMERLGIEYSMVERGPWSGGVTPTSATVKARLPRDGLSARLVLSRNAQFTEPLKLPPVVSRTNSYNVVAFEAANLQPDTQYHYALEVNGRLERRKRGEFKTFPPAGPASFTVAFASCGRTGSTREVYDRIREHHPLFYMNMGDLHYQDIRTNRPSLFRAAYDAVLASPQQADLYRSVPIVYMWDDHDYGGNNSNRKSTSHDAARSIYEEYVPHYPFVERELDEPIYQTFTVGRVKFIITDLRSDRDDPKEKDDETKSLLGPKQKKWFKQELLDANGKYPLICWMTSVPWIGERGKSPYRVVKTNDWGFIHHTNLLARGTNVAGTVAAEEAAEKEAAEQEIEGADGASNKGEAANGSAVATAAATNTTSSATNRASASRRERNRDRNAGSDEDHWSAFSTERREIADFIKAKGIQGVAILHGDSHMLAADDGSNADYATGGGAPIPVMCGGPLDQNPSLKGGPYSQGVYRVRDKEGESGFGLMTVSDKGTHIEVVYSGRNHKDEEKISLRFSVPANARALTRAK